MSLAKASVNAVLNMSINGQDGEEALRSGLTDAAVSTVAGIASQKIGDMASTKQARPVDPITHKVLHASVGADQTCLPMQVLKSLMHFLADWQPSITSVTPCV